MAPPKAWGARGGRGPYSAVRVCRSQGCQPCHRGKNVLEEENSNISTINAPVSNTLSGFIILKIMKLRFCFLRLAGALETHLPYRDKKQPTWKTPNTSITAADKGWKCHFRAPVLFSWGLHFQLGDRGHPRSPSPIYMGPCFQPCPSELPAGSSLSKIKLGFAKQSVFIQCTVV